MSPHRRCFLVAATAAFAVLPAAGLAATAPAEEWSFLPIDLIGARSFRQAHPEGDGRGVVIGILDAGVDLNVPGLIELPGGGRKIVDVRDFSGEGNVSLTKATIEEVDGRPVLQDKKDRRIFGVDHMALSSPDSTYWMGFLEEKPYRTSSVPDLNNNGKKDDRFCVVAFAPRAGAPDSEWVAIVDLDGDGQLDDEKPIRSYGYSGDTFQFRSSTDEDKLHLLTGALTILPSDKKVEFHIADGSHATHVAGIAAGYRLAGQAGLDGVAPGARILSLKIGNDALSGGATTTESVKKAMEWAADWAHDHNVPLVFNMSYGIGNELEGLSDIDEFIDKYLLKHPQVVFVCSNGNEGPGVSTAGTPASARFSFAMGNLFSAEATRDLFGAGGKGNHPYISSSRGGEVAKPDAMAPGTAMSTVPPYDNSEIKVGTSMSSPQGAGAMALLISAATHENVAWTWGTLRQAVKGTAQPLPGYTPLDQGAGVIQLLPAWTALKSLANRTESPLLDYRVEATSPFFPSGKGPASFWRTNGWFPAPPREIKVTVKPAFSSEASPDEKTRFYRAYNLESSTPWLRLDRSNTYVKGDDATAIDLEYVPELLKEPGLYVGKVSAYAKGLSGPHVPEWELWNTVIVPYRFENVDSRDWSGTGLEPAAIRRFFIEVPPGTSAMEVGVGVPEGQKGQVRVIVCDPEGHAASSNDGYADNETEKKDVHVFSGEAVWPGTWEAIVYANSANHMNSAWRLEAAVSGLRASPDTVKALRAAQGEKPSAKVSIVNDFSGAFEGSAEGKMIGYRRDRVINVTDKDVWEMPFKLDSDLKSVTFRLEFADSLYNRLTDCAVNVLGEDGTPLMADAMGQGVQTITFDNPKPNGSEPVTYKLQVWAGFTNKQSKDSWKFRLRETYAQKSPETISVKSEQGTTFLAAPGAPLEVTLTLSDAPRVPPEGTYDYGEVVFKDKVRQRTRLVLPIRMD